MDRSSKTTPFKTMAAVALQDHLLKDLAIGDLSTSLRNTKLSVNDSLRMHEKRRKLALRKATCTIDTGLKKKPTAKKKAVPVEKEYVLDPAPQPLTLAQKLGLIPHNKDQEKLLSETDWKSLKEASKKRDDFKNPCVICKDDFRLEDQVLLSCSHFFHRACLQAFERFTGRKTCPMCRHQSYQTRVVHEGTKYYKQKLATRIQAGWRGYVVRKWYKEFRKTVPPKDPNLRRRFYEDKLGEITDRMVAMTSSDRIDRFLNDVDESLAHSRNVFQFFERSVMSQLSGEEWMQIEERAVKRGATECPICLRSLQVADAVYYTSIKRYDKNVLKDPGGRIKEPIALLSCSHVFHATCLSALEFFSNDCNDDLLLEDHASNEDESRLLRPDSSCFKCPVCRAVYLKRIISHT